MPSWMTRTFGIVTRVAPLVATGSRFGAPGEEYTLLRPISVRRGYRFTFGGTVEELGR
jgi:hypothetical protein